MKKVLMGAIILLALSMSVVPCKGCVDEATDTTEEAGAALEEAGEAAGEAMEEAGESAGDAIEAAGEAAADAVNAAQDAGEAAMDAAGEDMGLDANTARLLTLQTAFGAARMALESNEPPATLRERVTSPGGTTERALTVFEENGYRELVKKALAAARERSQELATQLGEN